MREIKFRAWEGEKMIHLAAATGMEYVSINGFEMRSEFESVKLMQFTGLKDRNSRDIYEGDILQSTPNGYEPRPLFKIIWDESECRFEAMFRDSMNGNWELKRHIPDVQHMKIIGNIYENPELLK